MKTRISAPAHLRNWYGRVSGLVFSKGLPKRVLLGSIVKCNLSNKFQFEIREFQYCFRYRVLRIEVPISFTTSLEICYFFLKVETTLPLQKVARILQE